MTKVIQTGSLYQENPNRPKAGRIYDTEGISPSLTANSGGNNEPIILQRPRGFNKGKLFSECPTITTSAFADNNLLVEPSILTPIRTEEGRMIRKQLGDRDGFQHRELVPREDGISNTITTVQKDNLLVEPRICAMRGRNPENPSERSRSNGMYRQRLELGGEVSNTLTTVQKDNLIVEPLNPMPDGTCRTIKSQYYKNGKANFQREGSMDATGAVQTTPTSYRIRKLTERECFRLMDVSDPDIDRIQQSGVSRSQQYKMAGNSIVVACLYHIFRKMYVETENEHRQGTLF